MIHKCEFCDYICISKDRLVSHRRTHTGEKPFQCDVCSRFFADKQTLRFHRLIHTNEKPYKCTYEGCTYTCRQKTTLTFHKRTHTGEKPFKCDDCDYRSIRKHTLDSHVRRHHTGEKPFRCEYCDRAFSDKSCLVRHTMTHTGNKPRKCDLCSYSCIRLRNLRQHMNKHHSRVSNVQNDVSTAPTSDMPVAPAPPAIGQGRMPIKPSTSGVMPMNTPTTGVPMAPSTYNSGHSGLVPTPASAQHTSGSAFFNLPFVYHQFIN